jgi:hypothetical protein
MNYEEFLARKIQSTAWAGFTPVFDPGWLFPFQSLLLDWSVRIGRGLIAADCGLGKTPMQLAWAENVVRHTNGRVLILTPLAVSHQTVTEAHKFGIDAERSSGKLGSTKILVTNYEQLHHFDPADFEGVVCDESSIIKNFDGKRKAQITEFMRTRKYRLLCTATAAPNDYFELGTSSEALGYLGYTDMLTRFFKEETKKDYLGWGRKTYRFRGHSEHPFWQWVCSWARACRRPSDLGCDDGKFVLPSLHENEFVLKNSTPRPGMLFALPAGDLREQREERRITIRERCEAASNLASTHTGVSVVWCHLNEEGDLLERIIPGAQQVSGSMCDEAKEEILLAFQQGQVKTLVTKPKIACFGLNWQHCQNVVCFPSHSWEQYYQIVRRCWRFGQTRPVNVTIVTTEGEQRVLANLKRKAVQADEMFAALVQHMNNAMKVDHQWRFSKPITLPAWLNSSGTSTAAEPSGSTDIVTADVLDAVDDIVLRNI